MARNRELTRQYLMSLKGNNQGQAIANSEAGVINPGQVNMFSDTYDSLASAKKPTHAETSHDQF